ncbi:MAG TPA: LysM peptidoglycan-binding domain-containing protein [Candidatus Limnocylindrales bacterium]|nr:LysM peptidoglycan-binding domain-containing protein [Candidatus Limnocylindrales bacterium]
MTVPLGAPDESATHAESGADGSPDPADRPGQLGTPSVSEVAASACPYLISVGGAWRQATPSRDHRCAALEPPAPQPTDKQRRHCLSPHHVECPIFRAAVTARAVGLSPNGDAAAVAAVDAARRPIARTAPILLEQPRLVEQALRLSFDRGPGQLALVALMVVAFSIVAITRLSSGTAPAAAASAAPSTIARVSARPSPTQRPSPRPSVMPSASAATAPSPSFRVSYTVRKGDTLGTIAKQFNVTTTAIRRLNNMPNTTVKVGQVLKIP